MNDPQTLKHYTILSRIGEGGMGVVYRARDTRIGRVVALKVLPQSLALDEDRGHRFEREARIVSALTHPGIATLYEFDRDGDVAFLAMELVEGPTLRQLLSDGPLPADRLIECALQVAEAVAAAHRSGVVHRDLKPENIIRSESGYYKVLDFGIARVDDAASGDGADGPEETTAPTRTWATREGTLVGTVLYMSPEQVQGKPTDARSDIFALGSLVYELATGVPAFRRSGELATAHAVAYEAPEPLRARRPDVAEPLELVVTRCLEKEPARRYATADELVQDLRTLQAETFSGARRRRLIAARPLDRARRWRRVGAAAAIVLLAALAAAAGLAAWRSRATSDPARPLGIAREGIADVAPLEAAAESRPRRESRPRVVVASFAHNGGGAESGWIGRGVPEMLTTGLSRSPDLDVIATQRLADLMTTAGGTEREALDRATATELARWAGADIVIGGSVFQAAGRYRIDAQAYDVRSGSVLAAEKVEGAELFAMVDDLAVRLMRGLHAGGASPGATDVATTTSPEAYQAYLAARGEYAGLHLEAASRGLRRAIEIDPRFAQARLLLAQSLLAAERVAEALPLLEQVLSGEDGLPETERLLAAALLATYRDASLDVARQAFEELLRRNPRHAEAEIWWARASFRLERQPLRGIRRLREVLDRDPGNLHAIATLARELAAVGAAADARQMLAGAAARHPASAAALEELGRTLAPTSAPSDPDPRS